VLTLFAHRDEAMVAKDLEVLGDRGLADAELGHQLADAHLRGSVLQADEEFATRAIGEHVEDVGHTSG
jgi:hypothetical protein